MKFVLRNLKLGDTLEGKIEELLPGGELLINFRGDLLRAYNESKRAMKVGETVTLTVRALDPLRFQIRAGRRLGHLDVSV